MDHTANSVAKEVAQALSYARDTNGVPTVVTPLLYPGGGRVVLRMEQTPDGYIVSDFGSGRREAELMGGGHVYNQIARRAAERFAVRYDSHMIFDLEVPREALVAAAIAVGNASKFAVDATAEALSEKRANDQRLILWDILKGAFPNKPIQRGEKFTGHTDAWEFDAVVRLNDRPALFELVTPYPAAVNSAIAKFLDVRDLGSEKTIRVAVPTAPEKTPHLSLLGRTARIISLDSPQEVFKLAA
ncbi:hypothetical protein [Mesorhizobium sp.]|uniref:hypothetical protein n=1 Tax=Mesorhizobium sp. TaxID=1871066 RepID=UPI000FE61BBC|nr:hypothetical protein [Mesorhizobium sp.]RWC32341.1 MAG: hypothetical protein EOS27_08055 [Mesorhizobium sp.]TIX22894.1 MAG: hypothetical protein E5V35_24255 [Mesorhizobium sp.]